MSSIKVIFANICQGLMYEGKKASKDVFSKYWPSAYRAIYLAVKPDIVCLAEVPLDDEFGNSRFLSDFADAMDAADYKADVHEKSWLVEGKFYGNAIISKFRLEEYATLKLPNPRFEIDQPDGSRWILHDKTVQGATIHVEDVSIRLFNLHYFPFHRFNHNMNEPELRPIRTAFIEQLRLKERLPTILTGDFNNADDDLRYAYPELFENGTLADAVQFGSAQFDDYYNGSKSQIDHILYTSQHFSVKSSQVIHDYSDHMGLAVELSIRGGSARR